MKEKNKKISAWVIAGNIAALASFMSWFSIAGIVLNTIALIQISKNKHAL